MTRIAVSLALAALVAGAGPALAQAPSADDAAILGVIDQFMHAVTSGDAAAMARIRLEGTTTTIERPDPAGGTVMQRRPFPTGTPAATSAAPSSAPASAVRERYWDPVVHVRGSLAVVWTPYEFWRDGKTSHCGIDVFELTKQAGAWKIGNVMYTVEPDACPAMRPKDPGRVHSRGLASFGLVRGDSGIRATNTFVATRYEALRPVGTATRPRWADMTATI